MEHRGVEARAEEVLADHEVPPHAVAPGPGEVAALVAVVKKRVVGDDGPLRHVVERVAAARLERVEGEVVAADGCPGPLVHQRALRELDGVVDKSRVGRPAALRLFRRFDADALFRREEESRPEHAQVLRRERRRARPRAAAGRAVEEHVADVHAVRRVADRERIGAARVLEPYFVAIWRARRVDVQHVRALVHPEPRQIAVRFDGLAALVVRDGVVERERRAAVDPGLGGLPDEARGARRAVAGLVFVVAVGDRRPARYEDRFR
mmetsp:Transcript_9677/g.29035  ORF Transcript_9677/g.29035 Transcript_9677/m.29035 type:complete len:265 (-) Transcript_9677:40-834(-)